MVVYYHRYPPFVQDEHNKPIPPLRLEPRLGGMLGRLGQMVDFIVITANGPHMLRDLIEETTGRQVLSMIDATIEEVRRRGWHAVGVLGLGEPRVYMIALAPLGIACETLPEEAGGLRDKLDQAILQLMAGQVGPEGKEAALRAVDRLRATGVDGIILGCTEIPVLLGDAAQAPDLINPLELLAESAVRFAME